MGYLPISQEFSTSLPYTFSATQTFGAGIEITGNDSNGHVITFAGQTGFVETTANSSTEDATIVFYIYPKGSTTPTTAFTIGTPGAGYTITSDFTFQVYSSSLSATAFIAYTDGTIQTYKNTLDDGLGNITAANIITAAGFKTTAGAATAITVGTSPYTYTNSSSSNQEILITGGTITALSFGPDGGTGISLNLGLSQIIMRPNDTLTITYTAAPTVNTIQL